MKIWRAAYYDACHREMKQLYDKRHELLFIFHNPQPKLVERVIKAYHPLDTEKLIEEAHSKGLEPGKAAEYVLNKALFQGAFFAKNEAGRVKEKKPRSQSAMTNVVKKFAASFPGRDLSAVKRMIEEIRKFELIPLQDEHAERAYQQETAEDVLYTRRILTKEKVLRKVLERIPVAGGFLTKMVLQRTAAWGCSSMCNALTAALRAKKIPAKFVRTILLGEPHSYVRFRLAVEGKEKEFLADP